MKVYAGVGLDRPRVLGRREKFQSFGRTQMTRFFYVLSIPPTSFLQKYVWNTFTNKIIREKKLYKFYFLWLCLNENVTLYRDACIRK